LQTLPLLRDTIRVDYLIAGTKDKQIYPVRSDCKLEMPRRVMLDFLPRNWYATFGGLVNAVRNLLLRMSIKNSMLSSISGRMHAMLECQSHKTSCTIECRHQYHEQKQFANEC
jgi:hypothetical protein